MNTDPLNQNRDIRISSQVARGPFLLLIDGEDAKYGTRITDLLPPQGTKLLLCERGSGHQISPSSDRLYLVVAVVVLVSTLVSTWCPPSPKIESTAAKW